MADRVMLAANKPVTDTILEKHFREVDFLYAQPKIDGMRVYLGDNCIPQSRSGKEWKHKALRAWAADHPSLRGLDGEVVPGHTYHEGSFREGMSSIRAADGDHVFTFWMFDTTKSPDLHYRERLDVLKGISEEWDEYIENDRYHCRLVVCPTHTVRSVEEVRDFEERMIAEGWEGAMLRRPDRPYKFGRSTNLQGNLIKLKRYDDAEAIVTGYEPWYQNENEAEQSPLGYTVRSSHQENKVPLERLGALHVELLTDRNVKFKIGVMQGITHGDRDKMWENRESLIGRICKFKHQGYGGGYDVPRQPVFLNWRPSTEF